MPLLPQGLNDVSRSTERIDLSILIRASSVRMVAYTISADGNDSRLSNSVFTLSYL